MKKFKVLALILALCLLASCGQITWKFGPGDGKDKDPVETKSTSETVESTKATDELDVTEESKETDLEETDPTEVTEVTETTETTETTEATETSETTAVKAPTVEEIPEYQAAYEEIINSILESDDDFFNAENATFDLIYVDEDNVPELVVSFYSAVNLYTYVDGEVYTLMDYWTYGVSGNAGYFYLEKENCIYNSNSDFAGAVRYETYMSVDENHNIVLSDDNIYSTCIPDGVDPFEYEFPEELEWRYFINDEELTEEEYNARTVHGDFNIIAGAYSYDQIMKFLDEKTVPKKSTFSIIMKDCTWEEASQICSTKGGHLATINTAREYADILTLIYSSDYSTGVFYIGGQYIPDLDEFLWISDGSLEKIDSDSPYWKEGEPTHVGTTEDGREVDENYLVICSVEGEYGNEYCFMDIPNDILGAAPSYSGNIGFILEVEN